MALFVAMLLAPLAIAQDAGDDRPSAGSGQQAPAEAAPVQQPILADYFDGLRAWELGERDVAIGMWLQAAQWGDSRAMRRLGEQYVAGELLPKDDALAHFWFSLAAKRGDASAEAQAAALGSKILLQERLSIDQSVTTWQPTALVADQPAQVTPAEVKPQTQEDLLAALTARDLKAFTTALSQGVSADTVSPEGAPVIVLAAAAGEAEFVKALLDAGADPNAKLPNGMNSLHVAAGTGNQSVALLLQTNGAHACSADQNGVWPIDIAKRKQFIVLAALLLADPRASEAKDITDCDRLASRGLNPDNPPGVKPVARAVLERDAAQGIEVCRRLANEFPNKRRFAYQLGRALELDPNPEAKQWYEKAAALCSAPAIADLGTLYATGKFVARDDSEAMRLFHRAADLGDPSAMDWIGILHARGYGGMSDAPEASRWYRRAADLGLPTAMNRVGWMYQWGTGVSRDYAEARRWYQMAIDAGWGDGSAENNLGDLLMTGRGGPKDVEGAVQLYLQAIAALNLDIFLGLKHNAIFYDVIVRSEIQRFLIQNGYLEGDADGEIGPKTITAFEAYEKALGQ